MVSKSHGMMMSHMRRRSQMRRMGIGGVGRRRTERMLMLIEGRMGG